ncbi:hypothetical protein LTR17_020593 [Elasticomyces elasticus]|nr:hypothetical protein LTR17_020593 [Elasticomyces elasticus]
MSFTGLWRYATRIAPALGLCALAALLYSSFSTAAADRGKGGSPPGHPRATGWHWLLSIHVLILHIATTLFPLRAYRALGNVIVEMRAAAHQISTSEDPATSTCSHPALRFAIILPAYREDIHTLRTTLDVLASHPQAGTCYHVYLAMEEREADAKAKATRLMELVGHEFFDISFTIHPAGLTGEAPGKSSNESWAAKQIMRKYSSQQSGPEVVVTIMDADSHLSPRYFAQIFVDYMALSKEERAATFYVSPIVFDRNSHQVPLLVRTADVVWSGAGISTMYAGSSVCIPTSVYSVPLRLVERTQGWDTGYTAIGEDMHMYLKCFFAVSGRLRSKVIYTAASQCNVCSGDLGIRGYAGTVAARYQQALRHMWGMLDTGYALRHATAMLFLRARFWWCHGVGCRTLHHLKQQ